MSSENGPGSAGHETTRTAGSNTVDRSRLTLFFGVLVILVAGFAAVAWAAGIGILTITPLYMFTPLVAGLVVCRSRGIALKSVGLRVGSRRWLAVSIVTAPLVIVFIAALSGMVPGATLELTPGAAAEFGLPSGVLGGVAVVGLILGIGVTINAVFAFGEEFGWRGYLLWELAPLGFWKASLLIGAVWGLWHAPMLVAGHNYPSYPFVGIVAMTLACIAMSPLYTYLVIRAESVLAATFLHGVFNATGNLYGLYVVTDSAFVGELVTSPVGVVGIVVFGLAALAIDRVGAPNLTREFATDDPVDVNPKIGSSAGPVSETGS